MTRIMGRSPEMPKRQGMRRSKVSLTALWVRTARACTRVKLSARAVVSICMAAKFSALMRSARKRMPVKVADMSNARLTFPAWRYLSITACRVWVFMEAAVAKVRRALVRGSIRTLTASAQTGSNPVCNSCPVCPSGDDTGLQPDSTWLEPRLRPRQSWRSVANRTLETEALISVKKCAIFRPCSVTRRGLR